MPLQFYKPNKFNTGAACALSINSKGGAVYVEVIKQLTWDEKSECATFYDRDKKEKGANVKIQLDRDEIGGMIHALLTRKEFKAFHESETQQTNIVLDLYYKWDAKAKAYKDDEPPLGFGLSISRKSKENSEKSNFKIPFTFGESVVLIEYFRFALEKIFSAVYSEDKKRAEERAKSKAPE